MTERAHRVVAHVPRRFTETAWGGTERVLEQTLPLLEPLGFSAAIFTTQALEPQLVGEISGFPIHRYPYFYPEWPLSPERRRRYDNKGGNLLSPALIRALGEVEDLALVHCHTGNLLGAQCLKFARSRGIPAVLTLHGGHFAIPPDELANLAVREANAPRRGVPFGRVFRMALDVRNLLKNLDALICVGVDEYEAARRALPDQCILFLPGGVNLEEFDKADAERGRHLLGVSSERRLIVCVARVDRQKDQATLVRAWAHHCAEPCDLALVGPETSPGYIDELKELARGATGRLILHGAASPKDACHVYAAADISVLPSRHEPFGLTCLESWAAGAALVGANVGGPAWLLEGEKEGRLFPVGNAEALGAVLGELLCDDEKRRRLSAAGRARVHAEFGWNVRARRLASLYESLLEKKGRSPARNQ